MKLLYRGIPYEVSNNNQSAPSSCDTTPQNKVRLIYRGLTYEYEPQARLSSEALPSDAPTVTLMYRGQAYQRKLFPVQPYQQPRALNWRWQFNSQV
mgnify:FL=1